MQRVTVAIPAYNEAPILEKTVRLTCRFFASAFRDYEWRIVIADNGSTDGTAKTMTKLLREYPTLRYLQAPGRGKGLAIKTAWLSHPADIYLFIDADLATDLEDAAQLVHAVARGETDLALASRFHKKSSAKRSLLRWVYAHGYRTYLRHTLRTTITDAPCGAKAIAHNAWTTLVPHITNTHWFFDSELALRAEQLGHHIAEFPVRWNPSRVFPERTSKAFPLPVMREYIREVSALARHNNKK